MKLVLCGIPRQNLITAVEGHYRAAYADVVEFIADGAEWIWKRVERLRTLAEVLDFYHASQYLYETIATDRSLSKAQCRALSKRLRHALRHQADGVEVGLNIEKLAPSAS